MGWGLRELGVTKPVFFFWAWKAISMAWNMLDFFEFLPVKKNYAREKFQKTLQKFAWKSLFTREIFWKLHPWKSNWCTWKITEKNPVKKAKIRKNLSILPVKPFFCPWKNTKKCPWKKNYARETSQKTRKKWAWKVNFAREKNEKHLKKRLSRPLFFSRPKKTTVMYPDQS